MALAERLKVEVTRWGSIRAFQRAIAATGVRGSAYPTIHSYLKGATQPSDEFLTQAAKILSVRKEFLRTGQGHRTDAEAVLSQVSPIPGVKVSPPQEVLYEVSRMAIKSLVEFEVPTGFVTRTLSGFVAELYEERGPRPFGVDYDGWTGPETLKKTAPDLLIDEEDVRYYAKTFFGPLLSWPAHRPRWEEKVATASLLSALYLREFASVRQRRPSTHILGL